MRKMGITFLLLFLAGAVLLAGCTQPAAYPTPTPTTPPATTAAPTPAPDSIKVVSNPRYGPILTDMDGRTLYYFARDTPRAGTTACTGSCAATWPPFNTGAIRVSPPLSAGDFATFTRSDGMEQLMYKGWPLYYYGGDTAPGDTNGYGINSVWYVMSPTGVVTLAPTPTTTRPTTVPTTQPIYYGGGGY